MWPYQDEHGHQVGRVERHQLDALGVIAVTDLVVVDGDGQLGELESTFLRQEDWSEVPGVVVLQHLQDVRVEQRVAAAVRVEVPGQAVVEQIGDLAGENQGSCRLDDRSSQALTSACAEYSDEAVTEAVEASPLLVTDPGTSVIVVKHVLSLLE